ncbi:unnamed protein product, partial [Vitrella brassicaformis CCMP3155]
MKATDTRPPSIRWTLHRSRAGAFERTRGGFLRGAADALTWAGILPKTAAFLRRSAPVVPSAQQASTNQPPSQALSSQPSLQPAASPDRQSPREAAREYREMDDEQRPAKEDRGAHSIPRSRTCEPPSGARVEPRQGHSVSRSRTHEPSRDGAGSRGPSFHAERAMTDRFDDRQGGPMREREMHEGGSEREVYEGDDVTEGAGEAAGEGEGKGVDDGVTESRAVAESQLPAVGRPRGPVAEDESSEVHSAQERLTNAVALSQDAVERADLLDDVRAPNAPNSTDVTGSDDIPLKDTANEATTPPSPAPPHAPDASASLSPRPLGPSEEDQQQPDDRKNAIGEAAEGEGVGDGEEKEDQTAVESGATVETQLPAPSEASSPPPPSTAIGSDSEPSSPPSPGPPSPAPAPLSLAVPPVVRLNGFVSFHCRHKRRDGAGHFSIIEGVLVDERAKQQAPAILKHVEREQGSEAVARLLLTNLREEGAHLQGQM